MNWIPYLLTGGFARGYRTYILVGLAIAGIAGQYATGDINLTQALSQGAEALGIGTVRAAVR